MVEVSSGEFPGRGALSRHPRLDHESRSRGRASDRRQIRFHNGALLKVGGWCLRPASARHTRGRPPSGGVRHRGNQGDAADRNDSTDKKPCMHDTSRIARAKLFARVEEEFPLACPTCGGDICLICFISQPLAGQEAQPGSVR